MFMINGDFGFSDIYLKIQVPFIFVYIINLIIIDMLNPNLQNFQIYLSDDFFPEDITEKYTNYLKHVNHPFKNLKDNFLESIQQMTIPGVNMQPLLIAGMDNTGQDPRNPNLNQPYGFPHTTQNRVYEGNEPWWNNLSETTFTLTLRNNIINWMYCYEMFYRRYLRENRTNQFQAVLTMMDSAEIPMIKFTASDCFIITLPPLEFAFNTAFGESKTIDVGIQFNKFDVDFNVPNFKKLNINLTSKNKK